LVCITNWFKLQTKKLIMENETQLTERQSLSVIQEMIDVSTRNLKNDGILLFAWGCAITLGLLITFLPDLILLRHRLVVTFNVLNAIIGAGIILFTVYYIYQKRKRVKTYIAVTSRYTWLGMLVVYNLMVMIIKAKTGEVNFELLHPLQMTLIGLALFITGGLYRTRILLISGVVYWIAAYFASRQIMTYQLVIECAASIIAFVLPGYYLYYQSKKHV
jgi:hypothetical protein